MAPKLATEVILDIENYSYIRPDETYSLLEECCITWPRRGVADAWSCYFPEAENNFTRRIDL